MSPNSSEKRNFSGYTKKSTIKISVEFSTIVQTSSSAYRRKKTCCSYQTVISSVKQIAKARNPRIMTSSSSNVVGTSSETISNVTANAKTASLKVSIRCT